MIDHVGIIYQQVSLHQSVVRPGLRSDGSSVHRPPIDDQKIDQKVWSGVFFCLCQLSNEKDTKREICWRPLTPRMLSACIRLLLNTAVSPGGLHVPVMWRWVSFCSAINKNLLIVGAQWENAVTWLLGEDRPVASVVCVEKHISCSTALSK